MPAATAAFVAASLFVVATASVDSSCIAFIGGQSAASAQPALSCNATTTGGRSACLLFCGLCTTPQLRLVMPTDGGCSAGVVPPEDSVFAIATQTLTSFGALHGHFWNDGGGPEDNATMAVNFLLSHMPKRDVLLLLDSPRLFVDWMFEHVRYSIYAWPWAKARNVTWDDYLQHVVPYAIVDEKRDLGFRWRRRFYQTLAPAVASSASTLDAAHTIAGLVPTLAVSGVLAMESADGESVIGGPPVSWVSESSPGILSVDQTVYFGASCTGTAVVLVAAFRSVGIPARLAGCSQSIYNDDHHWVEFWVPGVDGPFGDSWHTKEGVSKGNAGGPWDSPSGPMNGCMSHAVPHDTLNTLWATTWSSNTFMPTLWANSTFSEEWSFVGAVNRCGAYCTAWGCGTNQTHHWAQADCGP